MPFGVPAHIPLDTKRDQLMLTLGDSMYMTNELPLYAASDCSVRSKRGAGFYNVKTSPPLGFSRSVTLSLLSANQIKLDSFYRTSTPLPRSNTSPLGTFGHTSELTAYHDGDNSNVSRQTSSSSSTSLPLEKRNHSKSRHETHRHRHKNGVIHDRNSNSDTLPVVCTDESSHTSVQVLPPNNRHNKSQQDSVQLTATSQSPQHSQKLQSAKAQHVNSLSISGLKRGEGFSLSVRSGDSPVEDEPSISQLQINDRLTSKPPPPLLHHYSNGVSHQQASSDTSQPAVIAANSQSASSSFPKRKLTKPHVPSGRSLQGKQKSDPEPKYADPIVGSSTSFQSRLAELASLEAETVRWERLRKWKKKARED